MDRDLNVTIIQPDIVWQNKSENTDKLARLFKKIKKPTDVIVLPEMFNTGFSMKSIELAEEMDGSTVNWMKKSAGELNSVIIGSLIIEENQQFFNRLMWVYPDGNILHYDKRHLFRMAGEHEHYSQGNLKLIVEYKGWKICPLICYDLRFPVWSRNKENYDVLIYIANWPAKRNHVWKTLLLARAMENQVFCIGVNRVGSDANKISYSGDSAIIDPNGNYILEAESKSDQVQSGNLSMTELIKIRETFPVK